MKQALFKFWINALGDYCIEWRVANSSKESPEVDYASKKQLNIMWHNLEALVEQVKSLGCEPA